MEAISSSVASTLTQITSHLLNLGRRSLPDVTMLDHAGLEAAAAKAFEQLEPRVAGKVSWLVTSAKIGTPIIVSRRNACAFVTHAGDVIPGRSRLLGSDSNRWTILRVRSDDVLHGSRVAALESKFCVLSDSVAEGSPL
jgi:hypothetical protein